MTSRSQNAANRLSSSFLTPLMVSSVPESADTHLRNAWDAIALFCHASMLAVGFRLVGLREDDRIGNSSAIPFQLSRSHLVLIKHPFQKKAPTAKTLNPSP